MALSQRALGFLFSGPGFKTDGSDVLTFTLATNPSYSGMAPTLTPISGLEYIQVKSLGLVVPASLPGDGNMTNTPRADDPGPLVRPGGRRVAPAPRRASQPKGGLTPWHQAGRRS